MGPLAESVNDVFLITMTNSVDENPLVRESTTTKTAK
jgi:hypothetical protein